MLRVNPDLNVFMHIRNMACLRLIESAQDRLASLFGVSITLYVTSQNHGSPLGLKNYVVDYNLKLKLENRNVDKSETLERSHLGPLLGY